jgi:uncharacterized protein (DUF58 family)
MIGEFHYRIPGRPFGARPGAHASRAEGATGVYLGLRPLMARPDPRRIDLRRSATDPFGQWLVRSMTERVAVPVYVVADVSASMAFGRGGGKQHCVADLVESTAQSAWRVGDPFGFVAADARVQDSLTWPATLSRAHGIRIAAALRGAVPAGRSAAGLLEAGHYLGRRRALLLLVSDFHFELAFARSLLASLAGHFVVPVVVWDPAECTGPGNGGWIEVADSESSAHRFLWLRAELGDRIEAAVAARRTALTALFRSLGLRPLYLSTGFDPKRVTRYFFGEDDAG